MALALEVVLGGGSRERAVALARRALEGSPGLAYEPTGSTIVFFPITALIECGEHAACLPVLDRLVEDGQRTGSLLAYVSAATFRSRVRLLLGDLVGAEADAVSAWSLLRDTFAGPNAGQTLAALVEVHIARGDLAQAEAELQSSGLADAPLDQINLLLLGSARLKLHVAQRRWDAALAESDRLEDACATLEVELSGTLDRAPNRVRTLLGLGLGQDATALAAAAVDSARRFGAPYGLAAALRAYGVCLSDDEAAPVFREAVDVAERADCPLLLAGALLDHGTLLRRTGSKLDARVPLRRALHLASEAGAHELARDTRAELLATGARPRRAALSGSDSLTAREHRVARMAANGLSNPDIAQALFITRRTVEKHVGEVLRKLELRSRTEIAAALENL